MARRRRNADLDQATLEANLQINPQLAALASLLAGRKDEYIQTRRVNASNSRGIAEAANRANLQTAQTYGGDPSKPQAGSLLAALKGTADTPEEQAAYNRLAGEQARSQGMFTEQAGMAEQARQFGNMQAREDYFKNKRQIEGSANELIGQHGELVAAGFNKLVEARRERQATLDGQRLSAETTRRGQDITQRGQDISQGTAQATLDETKRHNRASEANDSQAKGVKKFKEASPEAFQKAVSSINEAISHAKTLAAEGASRAEVGQLLVQGVPNQKKNGKTIPGVPKVGQPYVTAALDVVFDEHLSRPTQQQLNGMGIRVKKLGLPTYGKWKKSKHGKSSGGPLNPAGNALDAINRALG